jgi:acetolactate synthase-1/2/3 large subunit
MTQEARQVDILRPAAKELIRVELTSRIPELIRRAFAVATSGRPGPVVVDVPEDVAHGEHDFDPAEFVVDDTTLSAPSRRTRPARGDIERAAALLARAKRPLLLVGGGIHLSQAHGALQALAEALNIPVAHTMSGKGSIACTHPLSAGLFGRYSRIANDLIASSDCLLVVGCKLGEIATKRYALLPPTVPIIHLEVLAEEIGRCAGTEVALCGDAREGLQDLFDALRSDAKKLAADHKDYAGEVGPRMERWRTEAAERLYSKEKPVNLARMMTELNRVMPADSILVADGGFAAHWSGLLYDTKAAGRHYIADRGLAAIGYGLPGGIGASLAAPDSAVVSLTGDGGFNMAIGDLETARRSGASPTMIVVNNSASGYVKALQHMMYGARYQSSDLVEMNYAKIGEAMGCQGIRVEDPEEFAGAVERGMEERSRPTIVDVVVTRDPAKMLPGVDSRAATIKKGDRVA